jgi:hypothetical protein
MIGVVMSNVPSVVADAVASVFVLSAELSERVAVSAEMAADASFDFSKACDAIAAVLGSLKSDGVLTFEAWEAVRTRFEAVAETRGRDNGLADPKGAANDCWNRVDRRNREIHGLVKPKSAKPESVEKAAKRAAEKDKALAQAQGRSAAELQTEVLAAYGLGTPDGVAHAKALEKVQKVVAVVEKDAVDAQMKPLVNAANDQHKKVMEFLKGKNDPKILGDYVILLKRTLEIWQTGK